MKLGALFAERQHTNRFTIATGNRSVLNKDCPLNRSNADFHTMAPYPGPPDTEASGQRQILPPIR